MFWRTTRSVHSGELTELSGLWERIPREERDLERVHHVSRRGPFCEVHGIQAEYFCVWHPLRYKLVLRQTII